MATTTQFNSGGSAMPAARPMSGTGRGAASPTTGAGSEGSGTTLPAHAQGEAHPDPKTGSGAGSKGRKRVEDDAKGQFVRSEEGRENNGVSSASPRVTTGTDDATFENDPGE